MKLPSFQFYPGDWAKDPSLRRCSKTAKGVWMDMLCLMFECQDRGVLSAGGKPWLDHEIAEAIGGNTTANLECVQELLAKGVAHRNESGAIFSRRMVRDEQIRQAKVSAGKVGMDNRWNNRKITEVITDPITKGGSSSSSSTSVKIPKPPESLKSEVFGKVWEEWVGYRMKLKGCKDWSTMFSKQLSQLETYGETVAVEVLNRSMMNGWTGLFPLDGARGKPSKPSVDYSKGTGVFAQTEEAP